MWYSEKDRRELLKKLKKVRDPKERDRIIWALAGQEETAFQSNTPNMSPLRSAPVRPAPVQTKPERITPVKIPEHKDIPPTAGNAQRLLGLVVPGFFVVFGLIRIGQALLNYMASGQIEPEILNLFAGGVFLLIGLVGIFRALRPGRIKEEEAP